MIILGWLTSLYSSKDKPISLGTIYVFSPISNIKPPLNLLLILHQDCVTNF